MAVEAGRSFVTGALSLNVYFGNAGIAFWSNLRVLLDSLKFSEVLPCDGPSAITWRCLGKYRAKFLPHPCFSYTAFQHNLCIAFIIAPPCPFCVGLQEAQLRSCFVDQTYVAFVLFKQKRSSIVWCLARDWKAFLVYLNLLQCSTGFLTRQTWASEGQGGGNSVFSQGSQKDISRGKVVKFHFTRSKLRRQPFFAKNVIGKCQLSKPRCQGSPVPRPVGLGATKVHGSKIIVSIMRFLFSIIKYFF